MSDRLSPEGRAAALEELANMKDGDPFDILVIGGGITGAGIAVDAATRGLRTAIVETDDWASGTSSRSSNLVHGGLRYLQMLDIKLVWESLHERDILLSTTAPHLVRPQSFLFPLQHRIWQRLFIGAGILLYDLMATLSRGSRVLPWHRHLGRRATRRRFRGLASGALIGSIEYWDAKTDDAALVVSLVRTACKHGATALARARVVDITTDGSGNVNGARLVDVESDREFEVRAKHVISSTGVWSEATESMLDAPVALEVLASKGSHIAVPRDRIDGDAALILQTPTSVLFAIPSDNHWVIGTTDTPWHGDRRRPVATGADIEYLVAQLNTVLASPIDRSDVIGTWAGLRPLLQPASDLGDAPSKVSREHTVATPSPGFSVIAGGKLTTYRVMAKDAVDVALGVRSRSIPSVTESVQIVGAEDLEGVEGAMRQWAEEFGWDPTMCLRLTHRYGSRVSELAEICRADASMAEPLEHAPQHIRAQIAHAVSHEGALDLEDVLRRRTRIDREYPRHGFDVLGEVSTIIAPLLRWTQDQVERSIESYTKLAEAELEAAKGDDDAFAATIMSDVSDPPMWPFVGPTP